MKRNSFFKFFMVVVPLIAMWGLLPPSTAFAHDPGFVHNASGKFTQDGVGGCLHTPRWVPAMGVCGLPPDGDADKDGVPDSKDKCPGTPPGVKVDERGCGIDSDGDGVADYEDKCLGTPRGAAVDTSGCELIKKITVPAGVNFDFDSANLKDRARMILDEAAGKINANAASVKGVKVTGYTDSTGPAAYNQKLSERRANAVKGYLEGKGVNNVTAKGMGEANPVGDNGTREGRAANRRVEIDVMM